MSGIDSKTVSCLHFDNGGNVVSDACGGNMWSVNGAPSIDTSIKKFGIGSLHLNDSNSFLSCSYSGTSTHSFDCWVYLSANINDFQVFLSWQNSGYTYAVYSLADNTLRLTRVGNDELSYSSLTRETWYHLYVYSDTHYTYVYLNGIKVISAHYSNTTQNLSNILIGKSNATYGSNFYIDEFRISSDVRWTSNFTSPTAPYSSPKSLYIDRRTTVAGVYSLTSGNFSKVADDWSTLSDAQKIQLFTSADNDIPTINNLSSINKFNIVSYDSQNSAITTNLSAVAKDQTVIPSELIPITAYQCINNITPIQTITKSVQDSAANIRYAFTNNLTDYKVYNTSTSTWDTIDIANISTLGMTLAQVTAVTKTQWDSLLFVNGSGGLGIGFFMSKSYVADVVNIDSLSLNVDMKGSWNHAVYGTDVTYGYSTNTMLKVTLLTNGSYKINYNELTK